MGEPLQGDDLRVVQRLDPEATSLLDAFRVPHLDQPFVSAENAEVVICHICPRSKAGDLAELRLSDPGQLRNVVAHVNTQKHRKVRKKEACPSRHVEKTCGP